MGNAPRLPLSPLCAALPLFLVGCAGVQSALEPAGVQAAAIHRITWAMFFGGAAIFAGVLALAAFAIFAPPRWRARLAGRAFVASAGIAFPIVVLTILLVYGLALAGQLVGAASEATLRIAVVGEQWWWRVHYLDADGEIAAASANEVRLPAGTPVEILLTTEDVIHSFWAPTLAGKLDMIPGRVNRLVVEAGRAGVYRGQCAEYCGGQHALMAFDVVVLEEAAFADWLEREAGPAAPARTAPAQRGQEAFLENGCGACHTIRGIAAAGLIGPDLTHVGGRRSIAAGTLANEPEAIAAWIGHAQDIKPGSGMPSFSFIPAEDQAAIAAYLKSLE
jgi:cytochrome c oxidase subunit 2